MQQLHVVGLTTDHSSLICSSRKGAKSGGFVVPLDEHLLQVIAEAVRRRNAEGAEIEVPEALSSVSASVWGAAPRRQSQLNPREIQDRLRAGRSLEEIAAEAGVGEEWVGRFAAPVEAERSRVVGRARQLTFIRPRHGDSGEPLGMAARWNLADRGVRMTNDEFDAAWSAYQIADQAWMVTFTFESRKRQQVAEWEVDLGTGDLISRNRLGTELGYVEPGRRRRPTASLQPMRPASVGRGSAAVEEAVDADELVETAVAGARARRAPSKKAVRSTSAKASSASSSGAKRVTTKKTAAKKTAAKKTAAKKTAAKKTAAKKTAAKKTAAKKTAAKKAAARAATAKRGTAPARGAAKRPRTAAASVRGTAKRSAASRSSTTSRKAPAKTTAARKAVAARTTSSRGGRRTARPGSRAARGAPPAAARENTAREVVPERAEPNELGRRRLQLVAGQASPAGTGGRPGAGRPSAGQAAPAQGPTGVRIAADRSADVVRRPARQAQPQPASASAAVPESEVDTGLDVGATEALAEARRAERRRARAAARASEVAGAPQGRRSQPTAGDAAGGDEGDGRVVNIRANRARPPTGDAELVLPPDRPALRPAQPATQPRKRRFARGGR